jgi:glutathione synthase
VTLSVAIQMDPIQSIDIDGDSTFALALEAQARGHSLFYYLPKNLSLNEGVVVARGQDLTVRREQGNFATLGEERQIDLSTMDVVLLRQDPPFDMGYITTTHLLERIHPKTLVVNDPGHVRNAPEKILVTEFPDLMPETLITANMDDIAAFRTEYKDIILKPLYGNGGAGVFRVREGDENLNALFEMFEQFYREPIIVQRYLPEVRQGDKRIILVDGKAAGVINRVPAEGETRSNMHVGGKAIKSDMTRRDHEICEAIGPMLSERGLIFVGIDVIGDYLTEINVTSPTGIQEIDGYDGINLSSLVWDAIEARR